MYSTLSVGKNSKVSFLKIFIASYVGNALETYDFVLCGVLAVKLSQIFFPVNNEHTSLLLTLIAYGIGFVLRPLGAVFFGYIGDIYGRKLAMSYALLGMSLATACFAVLPDFATIGVYAPILFILLRCIQGFCIGGESQGGAVFVIEHFWHNNPAKHGAFFATSNGLGALMACLVSIYFMVHGANALSWRYTFLFGASVGIVGLFIRFFVPETAVFQKYTSQSKSLNNPFKNLIQKNFRNSLRVFFFVVFIASLTHLGFTFVNVYLASILKFPSIVALKTAAIGTLLAMSSVFLAGFLFKRINYYAIIKVCCWLAIPLLPISLFLLSIGTYWSVASALLIIAVITGGLCGAAPFFIVTNFSQESRYTGSSLVNNLAQGFLGGFFPTIAFGLLNKFQSIWAPAFYLSALSIIFLLIEFYYKEDICNTNS